MDKQKKKPERLNNVIIEVESQKRKRVFINIIYSHHQDQYLIEKEVIVDIEKKDVDQEVEVEQDQDQEIIKINIVIADQDQEDIIQIVIEEENKHFFNIFVKNNLM